MHYVAILGLRTYDDVKLIWLEVWRGKHGLHHKLVLVLISRVRIKWLKHYCSREGGRREGGERGGGRERERERERKGREIITDTEITGIHE